MCKTSESDKSSFLGPNIVIKIVFFCDYVINVNCKCFSFSWSKKRIAMSLSQQLHHTIKTILRKFLPIYTSDASFASKGQ